MIEIIPIGGYSEVGRNMTAVRYKDEVVILDMGVHLERYIKFKGDDDLEAFSYKDLLAASAVPDDTIIKDIKKKVVAIVPSHAHLDHIGAIPYMASRYDAPIICTPYTAAVIKAILNDKKSNIPNKIITINLDKNVKISDNITIEFINITHSVPDSAIVAIHTPDGTVIYTNDFKLDNTPVMGQPPNYERLEQLGKEGNVQALILDSLYADVQRHTPSEAVARQMLKEVMLDSKASENGMIVTTFSSHIARLKSIVEFGRKIKRKVVFCGRSLTKYVKAAESIGIVDFSRYVDIIPFKDQMARKLKQIDKEGRKKYLIVATGHQGEPDAVLSRLALGKFPYRLQQTDHVIFSCNIIPSDINAANRDMLEKKLLEQHVRIFKDIHQSGHASREDHRDMITLVKPRHIIPSHAGERKSHALADLAEEMGYKSGKNVHILHDHQKLQIS